ncbi:MAG: glycine cleavage system protein GcvH [Acidimicrobiia bacterium]|nr:glycine cleavage system protein GcvH [Acidimicrobiia bacterium]
MDLPGDLQYTREHEWIRREDDGSLVVGITEYAQDQLGDVVFVEVRPVDTLVGAGDTIAEVESTKSVAEVYSPVAGKVLTINENLMEQPELVNTDPYGEGWFAAITPDAEVDDSAWLTADEYRDLTE